MIAITGTPGTGKSTVAEILRKRGYVVLSVNEIAEKFGCIEEEEDGVKIVDLECLEKVEVDADFVEGHLSHHLNAKTVIVLRCRPDVLYERLVKKGWSEEKIRENVEAELIDYILVEALEKHDDVHEIDTTNLTPEEVADKIEEILRGKKYPPGKIDWISELSDSIDKYIRKL
ncbi:Adenylate kinase [Ferroglobus placidus DSM 10642]|uniref:Putative adenylate kinase n=1 Tax=Ferroglobus placidus (strain DSM 10642 / AEDII12DO) TaxID=589924 RepID=D3RZ64_FERPA|nr:adenylate kinase family protein [Ferroglobus placidus]ADC65777.1 Adenylate kinase [Ferroglobus placidus DSM 10642]